MSGFIAELLKNNLFTNNDLRNIKTDDAKSSYAPDATYKGSIYRTNAKSTQFQLSLTWQYDENLVDLFLQAAGFSAQQIKQVWFGKYVQYWSGEAIMRTQREWSLHFANHMQSYLLRPDFFEQVNGMLDDDSPATNTAKPRTTPKKLIVPMLNNGSQLQAWALSKGLPEAAVGMNTTQYYQLLCNAVERKKQAQAKV